MTMTGVNEGDKIRTEKVVIEALKITQRGVFRRPAATMLNGQWRNGMSNA